LKKHGQGGGDGNREEGRDRKIAEMVSGIEEEQTPYQIKLKHLSKIIGILISAVSFLIFILGY